MNNNSGFTLIEVIVGAVILSLVLLASGQATSVMMQTVREAEKKQAAFEESQDLIMFIRRAGKNISMSRLNLPSTFVSNDAGLQAVATSGAGTPSLTINVTDWLSGSDGNPLYSRAQAQSQYQGPAAPVRLDSFTLEEHVLIKSGNALNKRTRRLLVSRCDRWANDFKIAETPGKPAVTAIYVLGAMTRRPFLSLDGNGRPQLRCCPVNNPNCSDGTIRQNFFRAYAITLDNSHRVVAVEEFPKLDPNNPALGGGFGLYFGNAAGTNVAIQTFSVTSRCHLRSVASNEVCRIRDPEQFVQSAVSVPGTILIDTRSISTSVTNDIVKTGVISL